MANWTSPHTYAVDEELTAALLNTYQRDNLQYLYDRLVCVAGTDLSPVTTSGASYFQTATADLDAGTWVIMCTFQVDCDTGAGGVVDLRLKSGTTTLQDLRAGSILVGSKGRCAPTMVIQAVLAAPATVTANVNTSGATNTVNVCKLTAVRTDV